MGKVVHACSMFMTRKHVLRQNDSQKHLCLLTLTQIYTRLQDMYSCAHTDKEEKNVSLVKRPCSLVHCWNWRVAPRHMPFQPSFSSSKVDCWKCYDLNLCLYVCISIYVYIYICIHTNILNTWTRVINFIHISLEICAYITGPYFLPYNVPRLFFSQRCGFRTQDLCTLGRQEVSLWIPC